MSEAVTASSPSFVSGDSVRLASLHEYDILDTPAEQGFDDLTLLASRMCDTPVSLVSLVDRDRQWFKARVGFPQCETDLNSSVCKFVLAEPDVLVIPDLTLDPRTSANPLVTGEPLIRFYAGAPLRTPEGVTIGSLCVIDLKPRPAGLDRKQRDTLRALARQVTMLLELRRKGAVRVEEMATQGKALQSSQARQRVVVDLTRQLMGIMDLDGTLLEANPALLSAIGADLADVVGRPFWLTPWFTGTPGMSDLVRDAIGAARDGQDVRTELPLILPNGETRVYDFAMHPVRDESGRVVEIMPEATDITELRKTEEALRQAQKMEAVGQLTGGLAHDFNNLLAGISGSLELMQTRILQGRLTDVDRYVSAAQGAAKRAAALTHRLLAFSRRQTLDPKSIDVNDLVNGMQDMIQRTVGPGIPVEVVGASGLWPALVDPSQLENALLNLCINARDAMPDGGRITVETGNKWLDERASRKLGMPEGQYLSLCVTDTGTGMPPEIVSRVFEPFFTTKPIGQGTGLGLSMIYGFAQQSGGQVRVYSEVGQGTTLCIYLPRHHGEIDDEEQAAKLKALPQHQQEATVLIVDDEPTVRMLITEILEDLGYSAIEAGDSAAGLKILQSNVRIDLLVSDVGLPGGMNGRQMADAGRVTRPQLNVLFITGYAENAVLGNGHLSPGMTVMTKPFSMDEMTARIRSLISANENAMQRMNRSSTKGPDFAGPLQV